ncbi:AzlD domain-containing protein [Phytoactinopolyspora alkaliphila]|uniref:AzlD domain-containing protein n=1 Tax=Phytoactinopolyspora alkaliphila TaxID=1783498 RepID=A0A6N9YPG4_9ACTN|nr:AzlD domain-containing protein [Phytoactinopolyspora alkaliphila]NED96893.1 AzlD domain-containing protein [Phytoactinopolyspora alkaliphila]
MNSPTMIAIAIAGLAIGTFAFRFAGSALRERIDISAQAERLMAASAVVLLVAVLATAALTDDGGFAGIARPAGVLVGGMLAWRKAPFLVVVVAAAATAAVLRLFGVP